MKKFRSLNCWNGELRLTYSSRMQTDGFGRSQGREGGREGATTTQPRSNVWWTHKNGFYLSCPFFCIFSHHLVMHVKWFLVEQNYIHLMGYLITFQMSPRLQFWHALKLWPLLIRYSVCTNLGVPIVWIKESKCDVMEITWKRRYGAPLASFSCLLKKTLYFSWDYTMTIQQFFFLFWIATHFISSTSRYHKIIFHYITEKGDGYRDGDKISKKSKAQFVHLRVLVEESFVLVKEMVVNKNIEKNRPL